MRKFDRQIIEVVLVEMKNFQVAKLSDGGGEATSKVGGAEDETLEVDKVGGGAIVACGAGAIGGQVADVEWGVEPGAPEGLESADADVDEMGSVVDEDGLSRRVEELREGETVEDGEAEVTREGTPWEFGGGGQK